MKKLRLPSLVVLICGTNSSEPFDFWWPKWPFISAITQLLVKYYRCPIVGGRSSVGAEAEQQWQTATATERPSWQETRTWLCSWQRRAIVHHCDGRVVVGSGRRRASAKDRELGEWGTAEDWEMEQRHGYEHTSAVGQFTTKKSVTSLAHLV